METDRAARVPGRDGHTRTHTRTGQALLLAVPPVVLALAGLVHPHELVPSTSARWTGLHVALVPVFPLLGVCVWALLRRSTGALALAARVAAFVYACFYGALDAVNGIAAGALVGRTSIGQDPHADAVLRPVLRLGNDLAWVGSVAFLVGVLLTVAVLVRRSGRRVWPGAALSVVAAVSFLDSHIYWPRGVVTMLVLAAGFVLLARAAHGTAGRRTG